MKLHFRAARIDFSESPWVLTKVCIPQEERAQQEILCAYWKRKAVVVCFLPLPQLMFLSFSVTQTQNEILGHSKTMKRF